MIINELEKGRVYRWKDLSRYDQVQYSIKRKKLDRLTITRTMFKRVPPNAKGFRVSCSYDDVLAVTSKGGAGYRATGSSYNRYYSKKHKQSYGAKLHREANSIGPMDQPGDFLGVTEVAAYTRAIEKTKNSRFGRSEDKIAESDCDGFRSEMGGDDLRIHKLSDRSKKKIKLKSMAFFNACPWRRSFVTLTFIAKVDHRTAVVILNTFLTQLRKVFPDLEYLWVAEKQKQNKAFPDNIHFHMIVNHRLLVRKYNALWLECQYNAGLRGTNKHGRLIDIEEIRRAIKNKEAGKYFNPFHIKKVLSINGLNAYLTKYIVKQEGGEYDSFGCMPWHCSRGVSRLFTRSLCSPQAFLDVAGAKTKMVDKKSGEVITPWMFQTAFFLYMPVVNKKLILPSLAEMEQLNRWILEGFTIDSYEQMPMVYDDDDYKKIYDVGGGSVDFREKVEMLHTEFLNNKIFSDGYEKN